MRCSRGACCAGAGGTGADPDRAGDGAAPRIRGAGAAPVWSCAEARRHHAECTRDDRQRLSRRGWRDPYQSRASAV
ncbi:UNVERIFIED_CONTAM: hypothetical protein GTU68_023363 [Idotea baltica]|nr:hypothetical protein [Idotea baltica]